MTPADSYQKQLRNELANVEKEIQSHNQQIDELNSRLEALKRALELFDSEQSAIAELLRTANPDLNGLFERSAASPTAKSSPSRASRRSERGRRSATASAVRSRPAAESERGGLKRLDMIAAALKRQPGMSVQQLMAALARQFGWRPAESGVTNLLYTNPDKFARTKPDRAANRPVTWSLK